MCICRFEYHRCSYLCLYARVVLSCASIILCQSGDSGRSRWLPRRLKASKAAA